MNKLNLSKCLKEITNYFNDLEISIANSEYIGEGLTVEIPVNINKMEKKLLLRIDLFESGFSSFRLIGDRLLATKENYDLLNHFNNYCLFNGYIDESGFLQFGYVTFCKKVKDVIQFLDCILNDIASVEGAKLLKPIMDQTIEVKQGSNTKIDKKNLKSI